MVLPILINLCTVILIHQWTKKNYSNSAIANPVLNYEARELKNSSSGQQKAPSRILGVQDPSGELPMEKPTGWERLGFYSIRRHFKCHQHAWDQSKPLPTIAEWKFLREKYQEIVDAEATFDDVVPPTLGYKFDPEAPIPPPYYAKHAPGKGRGLFASRDIKKGEKVHHGESHVMFPDGMSWRRFIFSLPRKKACDMIDWTWTQNTSDGKLRIFTAMNIAIFFNGADSELGDANVDPSSDSSHILWALRDIKKGEELLHTYESYETNWEKVGLGEDEEYVVPKMTKHSVGSLRKGFHHKKSAR